MLVFRSKRKNSYNAKRHQLGLYHAAYQIDIHTLTTKTLCGLVNHVDPDIPFEIINPNNGVTNTMFFLEDSKNKESRHRSVATDISSVMCKRCMSYLCINQANEDEKSQTCCL